MRVERSYVPTLTWRLIQELNHQDRNVPIQSDGIVPKYELVHTYFLWKHISKKKIEELAIQKYKTCGNDSKHEEGGRING